MDDVEVPFHEKLKRKLDGANHERGQLEVVEATATNVSKCLGLVIEMLIKKGVLTEKDAKELLDEYYSGY